MPPHKAKIKWNTGTRLITDRETVTNEFGTFKVGGNVFERRSASRGGIHICSVEGNWKLPRSGEPFKTAGTWRVLRADGSIHSEGEIDGTWGAPKPSDEVVEEIARGG